MGTIDVRPLRLEISVSIVREPSFSSQVLTGHTDR
jgi:hypothetical protein